MYGEQKNHQQQQIKQHLCSKFNSRGDVFDLFQQMALEHSFFPLVFEGGFGKVREAERKKFPQIFIKKAWSRAMTNKPKKFTKIELKFECTYKQLLKTDENIPYTSQEVVSSNPAFKLITNYIYTQLLLLLLFINLVGF